MNSMTWAHGPLFWRVAQQLHKILRHDAELLPVSAKPTRTNELKPQRDKQLTSGVGMLLEVILKDNLQRFAVPSSG